MVPWYSTGTTSEPDVAFDPDQFPEAEQDSALPVDQVSVTVDPTGAVVGDAASVMPTGVEPEPPEPLTFTSATRLSEPPAPEQVSAKAYCPGVLSCWVWVPEVAGEPLHEPEAVQAEAFVACQVSVVDWPAVIAAGIAVSDTMGAGGAAGAAGAGSSPPHADSTSASAPSPQQRAVDDLIVAPPP